MRTPSDSPVPLPRKLAWAILLSSLDLVGRSTGTACLVADPTATGPGTSDEPPAVLAAVPPDQAFGITLVELVVSDPSEDVVSIRVEYDVIGDEPDPGWRLARAVEDERTEAFGLRDIRVDRRGMPMAFFWDTDRDLPDQAALVHLRFTATDGVTEGAPLVSAPFRIDNG